MTAKQTKHPEDATICIRDPASGTLVHVGAKAVNDGEYEGWEVVEVTRPKSGETLDEGNTAA